MKRYQEENSQKSYLNKKNTSQIDNEFKKNREIESKSIANLKINNVKKIQRINRTCQNTGHIAAKPMHDKVLDACLADWFCNNYLHRRCRLKV